MTKGKEDAIYIPEIDFDFQVEAERLKRLWIKKIV